MLLNRHKDKRQAVKPQVEKPVVKPAEEQKQVKKSTRK